MASVFSKIIAREIPAFIVAEDENCIAFLDVNPIALGHVLVVPKLEVDNIFDLSSEDYLSLWLFTQQIAMALKICVPCKKVGVAVIGLEVPHAHIHLVPVNEVADINFSKPKLNFSKEDLEEMCELISSNVKSRPSLQ